MSLQEKFEIVTGDGWTTAGKNVQYKVIDRVLYFQCTQGISDWKQNFRFSDEAYPGVDSFRAHKGFIELWQSVRKEIEKLDFDTIVGYSQGGALAGFAHENYFHRKGFEPMTFTFGCPRFIHEPSDDLASRFSQFIRVKNPRDIVTHVPPVLMGYGHVGKKKKLNGKAVRPKTCGLLRWLSHHSPEEYRQRLRNE